MNTTAPVARPRGLALLFGWQRLVLALGVSALVGLLLYPTFVAGVPLWSVIARYVTVGMAAMIAFGIFEQWPREMPNWIARWVVQIVAVALVIPPTALAIYLVISSGDAEPFWKSEGRLSGFTILTAMGLLIAPWCAVATLFRQRELALRSQAEAFALERSELERKALDSRLRLLQAQVDRISCSTRSPTCVSWSYPARHWLRPSWTA